MTLNTSLWSVDSGPAKKIPPEESGGHLFNP